ncbi:MAG: MBOAT family protein [Pseudomonadota bacterium]|nr:MBOAT family protein [Pseudomonadota bacterium]
MLFSSVTFLFYFLPCFLVFYYMLPWKNATLLVGSLIFYAWGEPRFVPLLMLSALLNYGFGYVIGRADRARRPLLSLGIGANLAALAYYKYAGFFVGIWNTVAAPSKGALTVPQIVLPLGISFFTFQGISYLIDVYRKDIDAQSSFWRFAMYKAMFPQLIAGPIVRYRQIAEEIETRTIDNARFGRGLRQFIIGLAQKVLIANSVALTADHIFAVNPAMLPATTAWLGIACYSVQILYDFAGYSNMAIGIGHMLGFTYPPNFLHPYAANSVTQFWRRWHISLSSWFRDYLYIPLGGNRGTGARTYFNLALVFVLCGLWHGAAWTFILWGLWHGTLLIIERLGLEKLMTRLPRLVAHLYTLLAVMLGWVLFRADSVGQAWSYWGAMFGLGGLDGAVHPWQRYGGPSELTALGFGLTLAILPAFVTKPLPGAAKLASGLRRAGTSAALAVGFALSVLSLASNTYNPFIYFRF